MEENLQQTNYEKEKQQDGQASAVVRNYKDTVFRMVFREKKELLSLFNAVNGTDYKEPGDLQVNTLENAIYMTMKNDIFCVLDMRMNLFEHQATVNPNILLRDLHYVSRLYEVMTQKQSIYSSKMLLLPTSRFIVLYNGKEEQPERKELRLSDSYMVNIGEANLELVVLQLNINPGYNEELMESCKTLWEYVQYVERVRRHGMKMSLEKAVKKAVDECIKEGILADFLRKNRAEVISVSIFEYDEEFHMGIIRAEEREEGIAIGIKQGERIANQNMALNMIKRGELPSEKIAEYTGLSMEEIGKLAETFPQMEEKNVI